MSVVTRTNRATNPNVAVDATNWSAVAGTGGTASGARNSGAGYDGAAGFYRVSWTVATTAASGGFNYLQTGLSAATAYTHSVYVKASKAITVTLSAQYQTAASANVNMVTGTAVALTANTWTMVTVTGTSGASVDRVVLSAAATSGLWANGDTLDGDCLLIETGSILAGFFDGSYVDSAGVDYAWTGTADASTSTAVTYTPVLTLVAKLDAPCDRVEITITDLHASTHNVTLWRTADGRRKPVRSYRRVNVVGSDFTTDYEVPLKRNVTYSLEVLSGLGLGGPDAAASITVNATRGWIQDPLDPDSAIPVYVEEDTTAGIVLKDEALKKFEYAADVNMVQIVGSDTPVALMSERMIQGGVPFHMTTNAAQQTTNLQNLIKQSPLLLIRPLPEWHPGLPGACYTAPPVPVEKPVNVAWGGTLTEWVFESGLVDAPNMKVVIPLWTYGDWQALWTTYQQAQTTLSGKTYLAVKKSPTGA